MTQELFKDEQEAEAFINSFQETETTPETDLSIWEDYTLRQNEKIIKFADQRLLERLEYADGSLRISDIVSAKESAFKQNQKIMWLWDEWPQLIPSTINIQIINN